MKRLRYTNYRSIEADWLPEIPAEWTLSRLGFESWVRARLGWKGLKADEYVEDGVAFLSTPDIRPREISFDKVARITEARYDESPEIKLSVGDVLLAKDGSTLGSVNIVRHLPEPTTVNGSIAVITPGKRLNSAYLHYLIASEYLQSRIQMLKGGMGVPHLFQDDIRRFHIPLPSLEEQQSVGVFLDRETAKIDSLIAKQEQLIATLREDRTATITNAVTKGLDPDAEMKDSGAEWLGHTPAHWTVRQLKWGCPVKRGASPRPIDDPKYFDDDGYWSWVRIADVSASGGHLYETTQRLSELGSSLSVKVRPGNLFVSIAGTVGKPCINHIPVCIHDGFVYFPDMDMDAEYLFRIFEAGECYRGLGKLGTQLNLNTDTIGSIVMPFPPQGEQREIIKFLADRCGRIDTLIGKAEEVIRTLQEYRSALITDAVTGKIDVRGAA